MHRCGAAETMTFCGKDVPMMIRLTEVCACLTVWEAAMLGLCWCTRRFFSLSFGLSVYSVLYLRGSIKVMHKGQRTSHGGTQGLDTYVI